MPTLKRMLSSFRTNSSLRKEVLRRAEAELSNKAQANSDIAPTMAQTYTSVAGYHKIICSNNVKHLDRKTLWAIIAAATNPSYRVSTLLIKSGGVNFEKHHIAYVRHASLFFGLLFESGVKEEDFSSVLNYLGYMHGEKDLDKLSKAPYLYLSALLRLKESLSLGYFTSDELTPELREALKADPALVTKVIDVAMKRNAPIKDILSIMKESEEAAPVPLRDGFL